MALFFVLPCDILDFARSYFFQEILNKKIIVFFISKAQKEKRQIAERGSKFVISYAGKVAEINP